MHSGPELPQSHIRPSPEPPLGTHSPEDPATHGPPRVLKSQGIPASETPSPFLSEAAPPPPVAQLQPSSTLHLLSGPSVSEAGAKCTSSRASGASCPDGAGVGMAPGRVEPRGQASKSWGQPGLPPPALSR
ncbi:unnamed protein product [Rangifer tarandus platyrhynchus]|uniref:Uncharacterized protein n=1 Tax=Rangifer tarandus platyrhynchus TaxID=3082113 RepID=A0AC59ZB81_RANTA